MAREPARWSLRGSGISHCSSRKQPEPVCWTQAWNRDSLADKSPLVGPGRLRNFLCGQVLKRTEPWKKSELLGAVDGVQVLDSEELDSLRPSIFCRGRAWMTESTDIKLMATDSRATSTKPRSIGKGVMITKPSSVQSVLATNRATMIALFALTFSTGLIDAVSFISLGHVFTANMTGNIVLLGFAVGGATGLSAARSSASLLAFMAGALFGGMINVRHSDWTQMRLLKLAIEIEAILLLLATSFAASAGTKAEISSSLTYALIVLMALAMGVRNAVVRKLAVPDLTTTVLTLTVTGIASDSSLAGGANPRWRNRVTAVIAMFAGAAAGAMLLHYGVFAPLGASSLLLLAVLAWMDVRGPE